MCFPGFPRGRAGGLLSRDPSRVLKEQRLGCRPFGEVAGLLPARPALAAQPHLAERPLADEVDHVVVVERRAPLSQQERGGHGEWCGVAASSSVVGPMRADGRARRNLLLSRRYGVAKTALCTKGCVAFSGGKKGPRLRAWRSTRAQAQKKKKSGVGGVGPMRSPPFPRFFTLGGGGGRVLFLLPLDHNARARWAPDGRQRTGRKSTLVFF